MVSTLAPDLRRGRNGSNSGFLHNQEALVARASKVEPCMFCGNLPCSCNAKPPKAARTPRPKPETVPDLPRTDLRAAMKSASEDDTRIHPDDSDPMMTKLLGKLGINQEPVDLETAAAIIVLDMFGLIQGDDKYRYAHILNNTALRARLWRERRRPA